MTPDVLRAAIASAREHPRMYGDDPGNLETYLHGLVAGAYDGDRDVRDAWSALRDPPLRPGVHPDATFDSVCDHALRVVAALCPPPGAPDALDPDALVAEVRRLRAEVDEADARAGRFAELLRATADALKGPPQPLALHSWHDLPEVAAALRAEVERLRAMRDAEREEYRVERARLLSAHDEMTRRLVDALKAPITRRIAPSVAVDVDDDGDLVVVTRSEAEAFAAAHPYAAGAILGGVAHRSEGDD